MFLLASCAKKVVLLDGFCVNWAWTQCAFKQWSNDCLAGQAHAPPSQKSSFPQAPSVCWNWRWKKHVAWVNITSAQSICFWVWPGKMKGLAIDVLRKFGISAEQIRRQTRRMLQGKPSCGQRKQRQLHTHDVQPKKKRAKRQWLINWQQTLRRWLKKAS